MWNYIKPYLPFAILTSLFMMSEVFMDLMQPRLMSQVIDEGVLGLSREGAGDMGLILKLGLGMAGIALISIVFGALSNVFVHMTSQNVGNSIRKDVFRRIMAFSFAQVDQYTTGALITRVTNDITQIQSMISMFVRGMVRMSFLMFGSMAFMFLLNAKFGLIVLGAFPFIAGTLIYCLRKGMPLFPVVQAHLDALNSMMQEDISGIRIIKACVRELYEKARFKKANDELVKTQLKILVIFAFMNPVINALMYFVITLILVIGANDVRTGASSPGVIMAGISYTTTLLNGILMLVMIFQVIPRGMASWKRIKEILDAEPGLIDGTYIETFEHKETSEHKEELRRGQIEFRNVSFSYPGREQPVLKNINLKIEPGMTVGIMGSTGCGKTTLVHLIPRFYEVSEGQILIEGVDVRDYPLKHLREKVAIVLQKSELFTQTIKENILWGNPDASEESVQAAARIAQAHDFIQAAPYGYDTMVAERGMSLSGGQKQRLSIARAVLKDADIFIIDDGTSALDLKTEADFFSALNTAKPDCTKIIVAQRVASVRHADKIVVLDNGTVAAEGTHEELLKSCPAYQEIYESQLGKEGEEIGQK